MSKLTQYIHAHESVFDAIGNMFSVLLKAVGIDPANRQVIEDGLEAINDAKKTVGDLKEAITNVKIDPADIAAAVAKELPKALEDIHATIDAAVKTANDAAEIAKNVKIDPADIAAAVSSVASTQIDVAVKSAVQSALDAHIASQQGK